MRTPPALVQGTFAGGALLAGLLAAFAVVYRPDLFRLELPASWEGLVVVVAALALTVAIVRRPVLGLWLLAALVMLNLSEVLVRRQGLPSILQFLAIPLLLAVWNDRARDRGPGVARLLLTWLVAAYTVVLLVSTVGASDRALAEERVLEHVKMLALYAAIVALATTRARVVTMAAVLVGAGCVLAAIGIVQSIAGDLAGEYGGLGRIKYAHIYGSVFEPRIAGPLGDPNFFAQILLMLVPVALALAWTRAARWRTLALGAAGLLITATVLTYSRGGALALGCVLTLALLGRAHRWRELAAVGALLFAVSLVLPSDFLRRVTTLGELLPTGEQVLRPDASFEKRRLLVSAAWLMFLDHPVRGVGAANYTAHFDRYADEVGSEAREYDDPAEPHYPHNLYLEIGAETGLPGLLFFAGMVAVAFVYLSRARGAFLADGDPAAAALARGFALALTGYLISSVFLHGHFLRYLWVLFACAAAMYRVSLPRPVPALIPLEPSEPVAPERVRAATGPELSTGPALESTGETAQPGAAAGPTLRRPVAVIVSRFPLVTETFILREIDELERQSQPVVLVPLIREAQPVVHREAQPWLQRMLYAPFLSRAVIAANVRMLRRQPGRYVSVLLDVAAGASRSANVLARTLMLFPKSVYLAAQLEARGVRHVHAHFATHPATTAFVIWRLTGIGYSITAHAHDIFVPWRRASLAAKVRNARFVRTVSAFGRERLLALCGGAGDNIDVIHVGVDTTAYAARRRPDGTVPMLLCVAALKPYKGLAVLLEACQRLHRDGVRFRCEIIGEGPLRADVERLCGELRLHEVVTLRGALRQDEVTERLLHADVVVAPSVVAPDGQMDGIPVALMEAMAAGCPVVASRLSGIPELVDDGMNGLLVEPGNPGPLADALHRLLDDPALASQMGKRARETVTRGFEQRHIVAALIDRFDRHNPALPHESDAWWPEAVSALVHADRVGVRRVQERPDSTIVELIAVNGGPPRELVVKIHGAHGADGRSAAERARHEFEALTAIREMSGAWGADTGFGYGAPHALDLAGPALLMERCGGRSLVDWIREGRACTAAGAAADARMAMWRTGRWLHAFQTETARTGDSACRLARLVGQAHDDLRTCEAVLDVRQRRRVGERIDRLAAAAGSAGGRTVGRHGDFWPGNVFVDRHRLDVIDFEGAGEGLPYEDVAYFLAHLELFFVHPLHRRAHAPLRAAFLEGYLQGEHLDVSTFELCRLAAALQMLAKSQPAAWNAWRDRWRRRAIRTMAVQA